MDNTNQTPDSNNTSTQKTVRLKPLVKQPLVGDNSTESQSVKKVSTNSGGMPKVGTQTGRISSIATNTARVVKINSSLKKSPNITGPNTTMMDFKTSELQMTSPAQNTPNTTRPGAAPQNILNSLNLKPKVAAAAVVETPAQGESTQTAASPKAPAPVKPGIKLSTTPPPTIAPADPAPNDADNTQTAAVAKPAPVKPAISLNTNPASAPTVPAINPAEATESDDATVKLKRPVRKNAAQPNSVVPSITAAPATPAAPAAVPPPTASSAVKPSAAPTVKLGLNKAAGASETIKLATPGTSLGAADNSSRPTVELKSPAVPDNSGKSTVKLAVPGNAPAEGAKLQLNKADDSTGKQPKMTPVPETPKAEAAAAAPPPPTPAEDGKKAKKAKKPANAVKKSAGPVKNPDMPVFHFSFGFLAAIFILAAATLCVIQYLNTYHGQRIQIPFMEQVGKF